tara:strand:- start:91 stop:1137 length:1047 start_codon:yes stop_codon:yes gene_type:complete
MIVSHRKGGGAHFAYTRTADEVARDFAAFCRVDAETLVDRTHHWNPRTAGCPVPKKLPLLFRSTRGGQLLSEYFHWQSRVKTPSKWMDSGERVLQRYFSEPTFLTGASDRIQRATSRQLGRDELLYDVIRVNSALMTLTHFRVSVGRYLCDWLQPSSCLDFSAGWGDRLTSFLSCESVQKITLIDPRPACKKACLAQHAFVRSNKSLDFHQYGAEDALPTLPAQSVDLIVTSPPYFDQEKYGETPKEAAGQIRLKVSSTDEYLRVFLFPVLKECARILTVGGVLALNVDDHKKEGVVLCKPMLRFMGTLPHMQLLGTAGLRKGSGFGQGITSTGVAKAEPVYLFRRVK